MRVSDKIGNDFREWQQGEMITITAGTGKGKSHFIKNKLYIHAKDTGKRILMLVHRLNCLEQFQEEIERDGKGDIITLGTYQSIEHSSKRGVKSNLYHPSDFDYVVLDEFHYFMSDGRFNNTTDLSLEAILEATNSTRIFMSATGDYVERYLRNWKGLSVKSYQIPIEFNFIKSLTFFNEKETLETFIQKAIDSKSKSMFFINDVSYALELHKKYEKYTLFNCSKSRKEYEHVDEEKISSMLENERFEELILITTTVMEAGVNIHDTGVKNIVCHNILDIRVLTQCIGRKRLANKNDGIHLVVQSFHNQQLGGHITKCNKEIEHADYLLEHGTSEYNKKFFRKSDISNITYEDTTQTTRDTGEVVKKVNELAYFKRLIDKADINMALEKGKHGYCKFVKEWFDYEGKYSIEEKQNEKKSLEQYLDSIIGRKLFKEEQKDLKETFKDNGLNARTMGINTINGNLKDREMNYIVNIGKRESFRDESGKVKKEKSHWIVGKIIY